MTKIKPWVSGLIDGISASALIRQSLIPHKNRFAFIVLDSTIEITFKNYIVNVKKITNIPDSKWKYRDEVVKIMKKNSNLDKEVWDEIDYFYKIRTGLYHEDSEKTVTDNTVKDFQELVEFCIDELFNITCSELIPMVQSLLPSTLKSATAIPINRIPQKINVVVVAVAESESNSSDDILEVLKKKGFRGKLNENTINVYMNHTFSYLFHKDGNVWKLSEEGLKRYDYMKTNYLKEEE